MRILIPSKLDFIATQAIWLQGLNSYNLLLCIYLNFFTKLHFLQFDLQPKLPSEIQAHISNIQLLSHHFPLKLWLSPGTGSTQASHHMCSSPLPDPEPVTLLFVSLMLVLSFQKWPLFPPLLLSNDTSTSLVSNYWLFFQNIQDSPLLISPSTSPWPKPSSSLARITATAPWQVTPNLPCAPTFSI